MSDIERCVSCGDVITDDGCACPAMTAPGALTREQVEEAIEGGDAEMFLKHDAALRQALAQQAQEVERVKLELATIKDERALVARTRCRKCGESSDVTIEYGRPLDSRDTEIAKLRQCWKEELRKRCSVQAEREELKQQLAAMTTERDEARIALDSQTAKCQDYHVSLKEYDQLKKQLAASQARCRVLEKGFADQTALRERHEAGFKETIAQLHATLAAREAEVEQAWDNYNIQKVAADTYEAERDAAVQKAGRLREVLRKIAKPALGGKQQQWMAQQALTDQHASGSSGGSANSGMGE